MTKPYEEQYKDMMDDAYKGLDKKAAADFANKMKATAAQARQSAIDRSAEDLKAYDRSVKEASDMWSKAAARPQKIKPAFQGANPVTMTYHRGIATLKKKIEKLNNHTKNANPKNNGTIPADVFYAEEIPMKMISNHIGNSAIEFIKDTIKQNPTIALKKKVVRVFGRVKHFNFTPDPKLSPGEPSSSMLDHARTAMLSQFYGLFDSGTPLPANNATIQVLFPDESDTSNGLIQSVDSTSGRKAVKKTSGMEIHENQLSVMMKDLLSYLGVE